MGRGSWLYDLDADQDEYHNFKIQEAGSTQRESQRVLN